MITVLKVEVLQPIRLDGLFRNMVAAFPELTYYDSDISIAVRYAACFDVFPLARCRLEVRGETIVSIVPLDTPWELEPEPAPLRVLSWNRIATPPAADPKAIQVSYGHGSVIPCPLISRVPFLWACGPICAAMTQM